MTTEPPRFLRKLAVPRPSSGNLASLAEADRPIAVFSDFDGTIFLQDTGHVLFDNFGCGKEKREELDASIGVTKSFREASEELWGSLNVTLPDAIAQLKKDLVIDPDFYTFFAYLEHHNVPFTVISAGMKPLLRAALDAFLGPERSAKISIVSNDGIISEDGKSWKPLWLHDSPLGHDKARSIKDFRNGCDISKKPQPRIVMIGDGVSDLAAASEADILFARRGLKLEQFCIENELPYIPYERFKDIIHDIRLLVKGNKYHDAEAAEQARRAQLSKLTGGLVPLASASSPPPSVHPKFGLGDDSDAESESDSGLSDASVIPPIEAKPVVSRPHSPVGEPKFPPDDFSEARPTYSRQASVGDIPVTDRPGEHNLEPHIESHKH